MITEVSTVHLLSGTDWSLDFQLALVAPWSMSSLLSVHDRRRAGSTPISRQGQTCSPHLTLSGGDKCLFISGSLGNRLWETEVCRQFPFLFQRFGSWAWGVQEARRWDAGGTSQREKWNRGLSQWHPCQSHRDSVWTPFRVALTWGPCVSLLKVSMFFLLYQSRWYQKF